MDQEGQRNIIENSDEHFTSNNICQNDGSEYQEPNEDGNLFTLKKKLYPKNEKQQKSYDS